MVTQNELKNMTQAERDQYLLEVLQKKLKELKASAEACNPKEQHGDGEEFRRGMAAGFVSGVGLATRMLAGDKEICTKVLQWLEDYNSWAQEFNRQIHSKRIER